MNNTNTSKCSNASHTYLYNEVFDESAFLEDEKSLSSWFGPLPSSSADVQCANDTRGVREANDEYCPKKNKAELDLTSFQYESFYASYAWTNAAMVIIAGIIVDRLGNHLALALFSFNCLLGSSLFAAGASLNKYELMLVGRIIFGLGNGSLTIVQNKITATWFEGKELAMAFGFTMSMSRAGSVLNFNTSPVICDKIGLTSTLWFGVGLTGIGLVSAIIVSWLDKTGSKILAKNAGLVETPRKFKMSDVLNYPKAFWALTAALCFFYNGIFPFMAEAPDFIRMKYDKSPSTAGVIAGICYDMSMILSPFMGGIIDKVGKRGKLTLLCGVGSIPVFALLGFTTVTPLVPIIFLGFFYSLAASALWPSVPLLVPASSVGFAYGVITSLQMISIGICNILIAKLRDGAPSCPLCKNTKTSPDCQENLSSWNAVMVFMLVNAGLCVLSGIILNVVDSGNKLDAAKSKKDDDASGASKPLLNINDDVYE